MNLYLLLLAVLAMLLACAFVAHAQTTSRLRPHRRVRVRPFNWIERAMLPFVIAGSVLVSSCHRLWHGGNRLALGNTLVTMPGPGDTKLADEVIGTYKLVKHGTDAEHIALCDATEVPIGFTRDDSASAAEKRVAFEYLGLSTRATQGTASGAITQGDLIVPGTDGVVRSIVGLSGTTVYVCGRALKTVADGAPVPFIPYAPVQRVIA